MRRIETPIAEVLLLQTDRQLDERGFLAELYNAPAMRAAGIDATFVQDNFSTSPSAFTIRGLHFQTPPHAQAKLVRVLRGAAYTVAVDLRAGSAQYGQHVGVRLDDLSWCALFVPHGFAHGVLTLEPGTEIFYKLDAHHAAAHAKGLLWNDPALAIAWPLPAGAQPLVSPRDRVQPRLEELDVPFP